jgi:hypothetical protein
MVITTQGTRKGNPRREGKKISLFQQTPRGQGQVIWPATEKNCPRSDKSYPQPLRGLSVDVEDYYHVEAFADSAAAQQESTPLAQARPPAPIETPSIEAGRLT